MNISEQAIDDEMMGHIRGCVGEALDLLSMEPTSTAAERVEGVDAFIHAWQKGDRPELHEDDDPALILGSLWGEQLVEQLGWSWAAVTFHDHEDAIAVGVCSPDRSLAIYPFHFLFGCMENNAPVTVLLSWNILLDGTRVPELPPKGYENVMDNVHHVVPRD